MSLSLQIYTARVFERMRDKQYSLHSNGEATQWPRFSFNVLLDVIWHISPDVQVPRHCFGIFLMQALCPKAVVEAPGKKIARD